MEPLKVSTTYSNETFCRFYLFNMIYKRGKYYVFNVVPVVMALCALYALHVGQRGLAFLSVLMGALSPFLLRKFVQLLIRTQIKTFGKFSGKEVYRLEFTGSGFKVYQKNKKTGEYSWNELWRIYGFQSSYYGSYYIYPKAKSAYIVEKTALSTEERVLLEKWIMASGRYYDRSNLTQAILRWEKRI